ncbi:MAG: phosphoribosylformylglycinamidine synthase, partial [Oscillospiraceae bacterium]|nr:phosphoribosylformylglycinamidine synthase [Oscillospiraceae bacterium]
MIKKIISEKLPEYAAEARNLLADITTTLGVGITDLRILNLYEAENISDTDFDKCVKGVFSENVLDRTFSELPDINGALYFAVRALPGQFDQRADGAEECCAMLCGIPRPVIVYTKIYVVYGTDETGLSRIKKYVINPVDSEETDINAPHDTLIRAYPDPEPVKIITGFREFSPERLDAFITEYGLAMDAADLEFTREYFKTEQRDPTETEIRILDTYWSDHCRHTTFNTIIDDVKFIHDNGQTDDIKEWYAKYLDGRKRLGRGDKPVTLMDIATAAVRENKADGLLPNIDESEEINACSVKLKVDVTDDDGVTRDEDWLLQFKNETHNHPTEIEPFGGAATCLGGAIRDPLS